MEGLNPVSNGDWPQPFQVPKLAPYKWSWMFGFNKHLLDVCCVSGSQDEVDTVPTMVRFLSEQGRPSEVGEKLASGFQGPCLGQIYPPHFFYMYLTEKSAQTS